MGHSFPRCFYHQSLDALWDWDEPEVISEEAERSSLVTKTPFWGSMDLGQWFSAGAGRLLNEDKQNLEVHCNFDQD